MEENTFGTEDRTLINEMRLCFQARSENVSFARMAAVTFISYIDPTLEEIEDIKTAVSEAVTNAILHGYGEQPGQCVYLSGMLYRQEAQYLLQLVIEDTGAGIEDIEKAMEPMYTTRPDLERAGLGFAFMEAFMDEVQVTSSPGQGTTVTLLKALERKGEVFHEG